jgi:hypothetical protein
MKLTIVIDRMINVTNVNVQHSAQSEVTETKKAEDLIYLNEIELMKLIDSSARLEKVILILCEDHNSVI